MLVLTRSWKESILIGPDVRVTVRDFGSAGVVLEVAFPAGTVLRGPQGILASEREDSAAIGSPMARRLVYLRREERVQVGQDITVLASDLIVGTDGGYHKVRLGFEAPADVEIMRAELRPDGHAGGPAAAAGPQ